LNLKEELLKQGKYIKFKYRRRNSLTTILRESKYNAFKYIEHGDFIYCYDLKTQKLISNKAFERYLKTNFEKIIKLVNYLKPVPIVKTLGIKSPCIFIKISTDHDSDYVSIKKYKVKGISTAGFYIPSVGSTHLYYPNSNKVYVATSSFRYFPLNLKEPIDFIDNIQESVLLNCLQFRQAKDVLKQYENYSRDAFNELALPFTYNEILNAKKSNNKYLMSQHYKNISKNISYNKFRLNEYIMLNQLAKHTSSRDFANIYIDFLHHRDYYTQEIIDLMLNPIFGCTETRNQYFNLYQIYLIRKINKNEHNKRMITAIVNDYVHQCSQLKLKTLQCNFNSIRRLQAEEQLLIEQNNLADYHCDTNPDKPLFNNKKNTKWQQAITNLKDLPVKILNTPRQLVTEGINQHNCVGGYSYSVKSGQSFIFHYDHSNGDTYTVEVAKNGNNYDIVQIFKKYNEMPDKEVTQYLVDILNKESE
jgi:hypothetical protein